eukprot:2764068-Pyramimonas_sp.AAC.1
MCRYEAPVPLADVRLTAGDSLHDSHMRVRILEFSKISKDARPMSMEFTKNGETYYQVSEAYQICY